MDITKGEWEAHTEPEYTVNNVWSTQGTYGAIVATVNTPEDAHLISAAPDMYEALKYVAKRLASGDSVGDSLKVVDYALAKAENNND